MDGLLVIDKPAGPTSHDVVARMRRVLGERRIGHTGTLDPAASGVLPLVIGRATRLARFLTAGDKEYEAIVRLGFATTTCDAEGDVLEPRWDGPLPSLDAIERALAAFVGTFDQTPPAYSAKKIGGVRSYTLARAAERRRAQAAIVPSPESPASRRDPVVPSPESQAPSPARVTLHRAELMVLEAECVTLRLVCSAGFYVRSLARDLGVSLGTGAHLAGLRRTRSGEYGLGEALPLDAAERDPAGARAYVVPLERLLTGWPALVLTAQGVSRAVHGRDLGGGDAAAGTGLPAAPRVRLVSQEGRLIGIAETREPSGLLHPAVVFV